MEAKARLDGPAERDKLGELKAFISYTPPAAIYAIYTVIVGIYTIMGGFFAAAITDVLQGFLLTTFSLLLIPIGLSKVGGFAGLHAAVPDFMFRIFGSAATSVYAWYTIAAMVLADLVSLIAVSTGMQTAGSAKDEMTARVGMIGGMFFKRFIMLYWGLTGLLGVALYAGRLHDPDLIWGHMTLDLLFPGAIGLMMAGVLSARQFNKKVSRLPEVVMDAFLRHDWPGNVRELENMIKRYVVLRDEKIILNELADGSSLPLEQEFDMDLAGLVEMGKSVSLKAIDKKVARLAEGVLISRVLQYTKGNKRKAAEILQISYKALLYKIKECQL